MKNSNLLPVKGCLIKHQLTPERWRYGVVEDAILTATPERLRVFWLDHEKTGEIACSEVSAGFLHGMNVFVKAPSSFKREKALSGEVLAIRHLGGGEQVLVELKTVNKRVWLPYQCLQWGRGVEQRYLRGWIDPGVEQAERMRLRMLGLAIKAWNENTGALSDLDLDPLPHQIHLVHHILSSGTLNWLIADDVGLGKTIETGMLIHALLQRSLVKRILLITPAGLTKQWQEELFHKFKLDQFEIYGEDFNINYPRQWKMHDFVIGSVDRFKQEKHLLSLLEAEPWDLIIFDEAHRLTRRQYGQKLDASDRYDLANKLRNHTESVLLLTATPHQGKQDRFVALLELLRPELKTQFLQLRQKPELLREMVFRNHKADVTDVDGNFIFQGTDTSLISVPTSEHARNFDKQLQSYLRQGYAAGQLLGGQGRAIGFVMTIYRKLATSSMAAIHRALLRRLERLTIESSAQSDSHKDADEFLESDRRYQGELEEAAALGTRNEFFVGEVELLSSLVQEAYALTKDDIKLKFFVENLIGRIHRKNPTEKILVFTEYTATQDHIAASLRAKFGVESVALINGSMNHDLRHQAISHFEQQGLFLISTEAGGEGINLHQKCHIIVNYDMPWNPMRLVQRIGRLYRYGQKKRVIVFNIQLEDSLDQKIVALMYQRINSVVADLADVQQHEYNEGLKSEILGEVAEAVDIDEILEQATENGIERTKERIDEALLQAREAVKKQEELFAYAATSEPDELQYQLRITREHLYSFLFGMFNILGVEIFRKTHDGKRLVVHLPETLRQELKLTKTQAANYAITFDRFIASQASATEVLSLESPLMRYLLKFAEGDEFGGQTAFVGSTHLGDGAIYGVNLRWQNIHGHQQRKEFAVIHVDTDNKTQLNSEAINDWLISESKQTKMNAHDELLAKKMLSVANDVAEERLAAQCNRYLFPESLEWITAGVVENK